MNDNFINNIKKQINKMFPNSSSCTDKEVQEAFDFHTQKKQEYIILASREEGFRSYGSFDVWDTKDNTLRCLLFIPFLESLVEEGILARPTWGTYFKK